MSDTNSYKTVSFSKDQFFAVLSVLDDRVERLRGTECNSPAARAEISSEIDKLRSARYAMVRA